MTKRRQAMERLLSVEPVDPASAAGAAAAGVPAPSSPPSRVRAGAVRTIGQTLERLREDDRAAAGGERVVAIDPDRCDPSFVRDRIESAGPQGGGAAGIADQDADEDGIAALAASIEESGQAVPILVRAGPQEGRYQIAYGHRRWRACQRLGRPVRAIVRPLSDDELVIAQGRENNERRDLTFIERAHFAAALEARGLTRRVIGQALGLDKSELTRLIAVAKGLPEGLAARIGRAPKVGRTRWMTLVDLVARVAEEAGEEAGGDAVSSAAAVLDGVPAEDRFEAFFNALQDRAAATAPQSPAPEPMAPVAPVAPAAPIVSVASVAPIASGGSEGPEATPSRSRRSVPIRVEREDNRILLILKDERFLGFGEFLEGRLPDLFEDYRRRG